MTADQVAGALIDPGHTPVRPLLDVIAILAAQQQQLDDLTNALETQHRTLLRILEHLSTMTARPQVVHSPAAGQQS